jgi:uncharacterized protein YidB (DUF937 family)
MSELGGLFANSGAATPHEGVGNLLADALGQAGGVSGLLARANDAGLGQHVQSWIGDGSNWPVSPAEIERIFPPAELDQFAQAHGLPAGSVSQVLAEFLPHAVDHATPDGDASPAAAPSAGAPGAPGGAAGGGFDFAGLARRLMG